MTLPGIPAGRIQRLNDRPPGRGRFVLYWMQQSQRAEENPALEFAAAEANRLALPLVVAFGLTDDYPEANLRHYAFLLEGLSETARSLARRGIGFVLRRGSPPEVALAVGREAALLVCDRGYLRHQRAWRRHVAREAACPVVQVEGDVVVPVEEASGKAEIGARTLRPRIRRLLDAHLELPPVVALEQPARGLRLEGLEARDPAALLAALSIDRRVPPVPRFFRGGTAEAKRRFARFVRERLARYAANRNQPQTDDVSAISPYLHFGQVSPVWLALAVREADVPGAAREAFLEELIVRRELACNFVFYREDYDRFRVIPDWAWKSLRLHRRDPRPHRYTDAELENARTHDPYWNAAMREMVCTGFLHNAMRMYWGKKILEWSEDPEEGFVRTLALNNRWFLDGRDPNSYAGVAWIYGMHDRAWPERPIYGKVRTMTASGLERKCDIAAYVRKVERRCAGG
ncbi:MAG: deoxyribodipyrimidine photo-lyase [Desulfobacterales bacterium]